MHSRGGGLLERKSRESLRRPEEVEGYQSAGRKRQAEERINKPFNVKRKKQLGNPWIESEDSQSQVEPAAGSFI